MDLRAALMQVSDEHGGELTPEAVVEAATPEDSPLHPCLTWDPEKGMEKLRLIEAGALIRSVKLTVQRDDGSEYRVRAYHSVQLADRPKPVYQPTDVIVRDDISTEMLLRNMRRDIHRLNQRYGHLVEYRDAIREFATGGAAASDS